MTTDPRFDDVSDALDRAGASTKRVNPTGVVHEVEKRVT